MSSIVEEVNALREQLRALSDRAAIGELIGRYHLGLDQKQLNDAWARSIFTKDAVLEYPVGEHRGIEGLVGFHKGVVDRWERTLHITTNYSIDLDSDQARLKSSLFAVQIHLAQTRRQRNDDSAFFVAGTYDGELVRLSGGWRIQRLAFRVAWIKGRGPADLEEMTKALAAK
jgi:hypothetical protein